MTSLPDRSPRAVLALDALAVLALAALVLWPALRLGSWFDTHEGARYAILLHHFRGAFLDGNLYPRWLPELNGGYGYPTFCFYQPGFFFAALPFTFLPGSPALPLLAATWVALAVGGLGAYLLGAELANRRVALFSAAMFLLTPYLWVDLYVRGDLSEALGLLLCPWPLFFLARLARQVEAGRRSAGAVLGLGTSLAAVVYSHPAVALLFTPVLAALGLATALGSRAKGALLLRGALALVVGLALSAPYWLPVVTLGGAVRLERVTARYFQAELHLVEWGQLFSRQWGFGPSRPGAGDEMSFQLGLPHFALATAGAVLGRGTRLVRAASAAAVVLILALSPLAGPLWAHGGPFRLVQFPWRLLSVLASLQVLCFAGLHPFFARPRFARWEARALAAAFALALAWHANQLQAKQPLDLDEALAAHRRANAAGRVTLANVDEFLPRTVGDPSTLVPRGESLPLAELDAPGTLEPLPGDGGGHLRVRAQVATAARLRINQVYFPGWRVELDGGEVPAEALEQALTRDGRMILALGPGTHTLAARYEGPPGAPLRGAAVCLALLLWGALWWSERRRPGAGANGALLRAAEEETMTGAPRPDGSSP